MPPPGQDGPPPQGQYGPPPGQYGPPPQGQYGPPPGYGPGPYGPPPQRRSVNFAQMGAGMQQGLNSLGIDMNNGLKALGIAAVLGLSLGLLSVISDDLSAVFGGFAIALSAITYAHFSKKEDIAGLIVSILSGLIAGIFWYILASIIGTTYPVNFLQTLLFGMILGALAFGFMALLRCIPERIIG